jgi:hypothetical protein
MEREQKEGQASKKERLDSTVGTQIQKAEKKENAFKKQRQKNLPIRTSVTSKEVSKTDGSESACRLCTSAASLDS